MRMTIWENPMALVMSGVGLERRAESTNSFSLYFKSGPEIIQSQTAITKVMELAT